MAVVDVQEHVDRHGRLTGWSVVSWDGYAETSVFVGVHKGEPDTPIDLDAQDEWCAWAGEREKAKRWAADVWAAVRRTDFRPEVGDVAVGDLRLLEGTPIYSAGQIVGRLNDEHQAILPIRYAGPDGQAEMYGWLSVSDRFPVVLPCRQFRFAALGFTYQAEALSIKRQKAVRDLVPGDELWELVFAWPEDEWESRWGMFIDGVREDRWGWGDGWVRTGDHLAAADWKPPVKLSRDLVPHIGPTGGGGRIDPPSGSVIYPERA